MRQSLLNNIKLADLINCEIFHSGPGVIPNLTQLKGLDQCESCTAKKTKNDKGFSVTNSTQLRKFCYILITFEILQKWRVILTFASLGKEM